jgi:hypothetical protein
MLTVVFPPQALSERRGTLYAIRRSVFTAPATLPWGRRISAGCTAIRVEIPTEFRASVLAAQANGQNVAVTFLRGLADQVAVDVKAAV